MLCAARTFLTFRRDRPACYMFLRAPLLAHARAVYGNRTRLLGLGSRCTTDVLTPHKKEMREHGHVPFPNRLQRYCFFLICARLFAFFSKFVKKKNDKSLFYDLYKTHTITIRIPSHHLAVNQPLSSHSQATLKHLSSISLFCSLDI